MSVRAEWRWSSQILLFHTTQGLEFPCAVKQFKTQLNKITMSRILYSAAATKTGHCTGLLCPCSGCENKGADTLCIVQSTHFHFFKNKQERRTWDTREALTPLIDIVVLLKFVSKAMLPLESSLWNNKFICTSVTTKHFNGVEAAPLVCPFQLVCFCLGYHHCLCKAAMQLCAPVGLLCKSYRSHWSVNLQHVKHNSWEHAALCNLVTPPRLEVPVCVCLMF